MDSRRHTYEFISLEIQKRGGVLIPIEYINNEQKLEIICRQGHCFCMSYADIRRGHWCRYCHNLVRSKGQRLGIDFAKKEIESRGGELISTEYTNNKKKLEIVCNNGHVFLCCLDKIVNRNHWCPECKGGVRLQYQFVREYIENLGGVLESKEYVNNCTKLDVRCPECNEVWHPRFNDITHGQWCSNCSRSKEQKKLASILVNILPGLSVLYNYKGFDWLYNSRTHGTQELDIYIPALKLAIEYDGEQHFRLVEFFGGLDGFRSRQRLDKLKNKKVAQHPEDIQYFIRFKYDEPITQEYVADKLIKAGVPITGERHEG